METPSEFLYPRSRYRGHWSPQAITFNANLQEFAQRTTFICNLETNGKLSPDEAYLQIKQLWKQLKHSKKQLGSCGKIKSQQKAVDG